MANVAVRRTVNEASKSSSNALVGEAILAEIKGIPSHLEIQLHDPTSGDMYIFNRENK